MVLQAVGIDIESPINDDRDPSPPQNYYEEESKKFIPVKIDDHEFMVNPQEMSWTFETKLEQKEVVYDKDTTQWMGPKLEILNMSVKTYNADEKDFLWHLGKVENPGPFIITAAIPGGSICMLLKNRTGKQVEGEDDNLWYWTLQFIENSQRGK